jgi:uncharacterized membrane protein YraQ (UPF0718 family)
MREVFSAIVGILNESSPYLLMGLALAGVIHVLLGRLPGLTARLAGTGRRPVLWAALIGAPMPLCSCSVLPAAMALRRGGASKGATASFLVSVPETDVVSVLVTLALLGPFVAVYRPIAAIASALAVGLVVRGIENRGVRAAAAAAAASAPGGACCDPKQPAGEHTHPRAGSWWIRAFRYGFVEMFDDIVPQLLLGIVLAGIIGTWLPEIDPGRFRVGTFTSYLVMVAIGVPLYVCAAASTPIAAGLIAGGVSPGAAMVFLLAGPATNIASLVVVRGEFGNRIFAGYLAALVLASVAFGALLDWLLGNVSVSAAMPAHIHGGESKPGMAFTLVFLLWTVVSAYRSRLLPRTWVAIARVAGRLSPR